jgi:putative SbcD/Mre11-related phosphoesterase
MNRKNILITPDAEIVSLALYLKKHKALILGDLHLGQEEELNKQGILLPRTNFVQLKKEIEFILEKVKEIKQIILIGDVKHEFREANNQEWRETIELIEIMQKKCKKIFIIKGNHDSFLKPITAWKKIELIEYIVLGDYLLCHGNKILSEKETEKAKYIIIGHEHAAITLSDEHKKEKFKCFIKTKYVPEKEQQTGKENRTSKKTPAKKTKEIIILPSLNFLSMGTDLANEKPLSPYLKKMKEFGAWAIENHESFYFRGIKSKTD